MRKGKTAKVANKASGNGTQQWLGDDALRTGLTLILADAARSHLKSGDVDKASLCVEEAQRCLASVSSSSSS